MILPRPKTSMQEVLRHLIDYGSVSMFNFPYLSGFRTRVSDLVRKHNLHLKTEKRTGTNKYFNTYTYSYHKLVDKKEAIKLYLKLVNKEKVLS